VKAGWLRFIEHTMQRSDSMLQSRRCLKHSPVTPDRLQRFQRKPQVLAALNHPNIAHIYGLEESRA
jgi:hypothetical protein